MTLIEGDCVEVMAGLPAASVDAVVCDPPYGLGFMGKAWDSPGAFVERRARLAADGFDGIGGNHHPVDAADIARTRLSEGIKSQEWHHRWATEALRVAKPGAYLLAFGGTRTVHRLTCAIEDAGWIVKDMWAWCHAQGFPKSRALLKPAWEPIIRARKPFSIAVEWNYVHHAIAALIWLTESSTGTGCAARRVAQLFAASDTTDTSRSPALASTSLSIASSWGSILDALSQSMSRSTTSTATGLTTALRTLSWSLWPVTSATTMPACECLVDGPSSLAPSAASDSSAAWASSLATLRRSVPESAIALIAQSVAGVCASIAADLSGDLGAVPTAPPSATTSPAGRAELTPIVMARKPGPLRELAIDACRIPGTDNVTFERAAGDRSREQYRTGTVVGGQQPTNLGRWPSNVILTDALFDGDTEGVVGGGDAGQAGVAVNRNLGGGSGGYGGWAAGRGEDVGYGDSGTYSRFFLIAKEDRAGREPIMPEYAYELHRARGECDKLPAWDSEGRSRSEPTASTSPARAISAETLTDTSDSDTSPHGSPPTVLSRTDTRSTTATATSRTTTSPISSLLTPSPTSGSIPAANSETGDGGSRAESAASSSLWTSSTGTSPERAGPSTVDAVPATSARSSRRNNCAVCGRPLPRVGSHPTVKPLDLMRHLVRLVTPTGGTVLDPFLGSGTTAIAAEMEGFEWVGIEREAEYVAIAEARLAGTQRGLGLPA